MKTCEFKIKGWCIKTIDGCDFLMFETTTGPKEVEYLYWHNAIDCSTGKSIKEIYNSLMEKTYLEIINALIGRTFRINMAE